MPTQKIADKWMGWSGTIISGVGQFLLMMTFIGVQLQQEDISETTAALGGGSAAILALINVWRRIVARGPLYINPFK